MSSPSSLSSVPSVPSLSSLSSPSWSSSALPHSPAGPPVRLPRPLGTDAPATREVPDFAPVRVRGGRYRLQRLVRRRGRAVAAGLVVTAAALVAAGPRTAADPHPAEHARGRPLARPAQRPGPPGAAVATAGARMVTAPVRIADAATVRLLRPGDRVDVIAAEDPATGGRARVLARGVRVAQVPEPLADTEGDGALVVLSVPRGAAARLVGASATARLAVTLC
ncbi:hypothetical protein [Streptomyces sp. L2]|uniref:hypothetical protein n=1 Tax=Streptomyces sp. L2 TaxID=2162665 RepID=UPI001F5136B4|nr:hypothetical protein [Streptomyces sp. L2]